MNKATFLAFAGSMPAAVRRVPGETWPHSTLRPTVVAQPVIGWKYAGGQRRETIKDMSIYRTVNRSPRSDVHHVVEHTLSAHGRPQQGTPGSNEDWTARRRAKPAEFIFPTTTRWIAALPHELQPTATAEAFPRILNAIAGLWSAPAELTSYFTELLVDKRGRRKGFPVRVLGELHALRAFYATLRP